MIATGVPAKARYLVGAYKLHIIVSIHAGHVMYTLHCFDSSYSTIWVDLTGHSRLVPVHGNLC